VLADAPLGLSIAKPKWPSLKFGNVGESRSFAS
jgi:hypothetical protein